MRIFKHIALVTALVGFSISMVNAAGTATAVNVLCNGGSTGSISVTGVSGGAGPDYNYYLYNSNAFPALVVVDNFGPTSNTSHNFAGLPAGKYMIFVTDNIGDAFLTLNVTISEPDILVLPDPVATPASCNGIDDGKISVLATGGTAPYTYVLKKGAAVVSSSGAQAGAFTFTNLEVGNDYTVTVNDFPSCGEVVSGLLTISEPVHLSVVVTPNPGVVCVAQDLPLTATPSGGNGGVSYLWSASSGSFSSTISQTPNYSNTSSGGPFTATVNITDINGCTATGNTSITVNPLPAKPTITAGGPTSFCTGGSVVLTSSPGISYLWSTGATTPSITATATGNYTVQVTNANGCLSEASNATVVTVNPFPAKPTITAGGPTTFCAGGNVVLTASTGTTYLWSNGATTPSITVSTAGSYTVRVTNAAGCLSVASDATTVTVNALPAKPTISAGGPTTFCFGGSVTLTSSAGSSYLWSTGATTPSITVSTAGSYTVRVTNAAGCQSISSDATVVTVNALPAKPSVTAAGPTTFCAGGSVILTSSAGSSYLWSTGATTPSITVSSSGSYTVRVTNAAGCQSVASDPTAVTVNALPTKPTISASGPTTFCFGGNVTLTSSAGTSYLWSNGATSPSITVSAAGSYTVQVSNAAGCLSILSDPTTVTVNALPAKPTITAGGPTTFCAGGSVSLTSSVGTSYLWSNGATTPSISVTTAGSYTVQVTNAAGCLSVASDSREITVNPLPAKPTITAGGPTTFCFGGNVVLTSSAGTSYLWSNGATTPSITVSAAGSYTVRVTNSNGCQSVASDATTVTVNALPAKPTITAGGPTTFCMGGNVVLTSSAGSGYLWSNGATTASITVSTAGSYTVQVTNAGGCQSVASDATVVTVNALPAKPSVTAAGPTTFCAGGNVVLTSSAGTSYLWSNGATTPSITVSASGSYTVRVGNVAGCLSIASDPTVVTVNALPAKPGITAGGPTTFCFGGSVVLTSSAGTTYLWSNGATSPSITVSTAGAYTVQVTNAEGCLSLASDATTITVNTLPAKPTITAGGPTTFCAGGSVVLTSSAGTSYLWSNGATTPSITVSASGSFTVQVSNAAGCQSVASDPAAVVVNDLPAKPTVTAGGPTTFCTGANVVLSSSPGTSYLWSNGATTPSITVNVSGSFSVRVTNIAGCQSVSSDATVVTVNAIPAKPTITAGGPTTFCAGGNVVLTSSPGASYLWSNGATTSSITAVAAGNYTVQVGNAAGCLSLASDATAVTVNALPAKPSITAGGPTTFCAGGSVILTSSAGAGYLWSNGATTASITVLATGNHTVKVSNAAGCFSIASDTAVVVVNALPVKPTITADGPTTLCDGGSVTLTSSVGTSYLWSNGAVTQSLTTAAAGSYTVQVTNAAGCQSVVSDAIVVTVNALPLKPVVTAGGPTTFCFGGSVNLSSSPGTSYLWSNGATSQSITVTADGSYTVQVTNASGCPSIASDATVVTVVPLPAKPTISAGGPVSFCLGGNVVLTSSAGTSYLWSNGATTPSITVNISGTYTVRVTNASGCQSVVSDPTVVTVSGLPAKPSITAGGPTTFCFGGNVVLTSSPGTSYLWSNGATTSSITVSVAGSYTVQVANAAGCLSIPSNATVVTVNSLPAKPSITASGVTSFCEGGSVVLTSSAGTSYLWSTGAVTPSITASTSGTYTVRVSNALGCQSVDSDPVAVDVSPLPLISFSLTNPTVCYFEDAIVSMSSSESGVSYILRDNTNATVAGPVNGTGASIEFTAGAGFLATGTFNYNVLANSNAGCSIELTDESTITRRAEVTFTVSKTDVKCNGGSNGVISVSAANGTAPYTVSIDNGLTYPYLTGVNINVASGSYPVFVKDANNCLSSVQLVDIAEPAVLTSSAVKTDMSCAGIANGTVTITAAGGTSPYTYQRAPFGYQASNLFASLSKGTYTFNTQDANGCTSSNTMTINEPLALTIPSEIKIDNNVCFGDSLGEVWILKVEGGTIPYEYSIDNGLNYQSSGIFQNLPAGSYQTKVKDANGCEKPGSTNIISQPAKILISNYSQTEVSHCFGNNNGEIAIEAIGGTGDIAYDLDGLVNNATGYFTAVGGGSHLLTMTDSKLCSIDTTVILSQPSEIVFSVLNLIPVTGCSGGSNGELAVGAGGGAGSYLYSFNNGGFEAVNSFTGLSAGAYSLKAQDANLCEKDTTIIITEPAPVSILSESFTNVSCNLAGDGSISVVAEGGTGPYSYVLNPGALETNNTGTFLSLSPGVYSVEANDNLGCGPVTSSLLTIVEPDALVRDSVVTTDITCNGAANAAFQIYASGGTAPYTYSIDDGITFGAFGDFAALAAGTYYLSLQDDNGCALIMDTLSFADPDAISMVSENKVDIVGCYYDAAGEVDFDATGGTGTLEYSLDLISWQASGHFTGLTAGSYAVTARDQNLCSLNSSDLNILAPDTIAADIVTTPDLNEFNKGSITISNATGGTGTLLFSISGAGGTFSSETYYTELDAGDYSLVIKDDNGCSYQELVVVPSVDALDVTVTLTSSNCKGDNEGSITMISSNSVALEEYSIDDSTSWQTSGTFTNLSPGTYNIFMRDGMNRYFQDTVEITEPLEINIFGSITRSSCSSFTNDGAIYVTVNGGTSPYTYLWDKGETSRDLTDVPFGSYGLRVTDSNECVNQKTFMVLAITTVVADAGRDTSLCFGESFILDGQSQGGLEMSWSPTEGLSNANISNPVFSASSDASYVLKVTGSNECYDTDTISISIRPALGLFAGNDTTIVKEDEVLLSATGGAFESYSWLPAEGLATPDESSTVANPLISTIYIVSATTDFGCVERDTILVKIAEKLKVYDAFSPNNGDDLNNYFEIESAGLYPQILVEVYTRWGEKLFSSKGYSDEQRWDGTYKGKDVAIGTYYYVIVPYEGAEAITGPLTIVR